MSAIARSLAAAKKTPDTRIVLGAAGLAFVIKVILAATTVGTNDVIYWQAFSEYILEHDSVSIYSAIELYNHPPLISLWLSLIGSVAADDLRMFAFLMRLPAIVADLGSVFLVWGLSRRYYGDRRALFVTVVFALSPVLLLVSGFHGNTDPVFMFLLLATVYVVGVKSQYALGGVLFGLSLSIKIVPVLMVPAFFFWLRSRGDRGRFFGSAFAVVALGYLYHLFHAYEGILRNVLAYGGNKNIWGIGRIIPGYETVGKAVVFRVVTGCVWIVLRAPRAEEPDADGLVPLANAFAITFLAFMVVTPGFGVQYLSWLVAPAVFIGVGFSVAYNALAGSFLAAVYVFWNGGLALYLADSTVVGPWTGLTIDLELVLWSFLFVSLWVIVGRAVVASFAEVRRS